MVAIIDTATNLAARGDALRELVAAIRDKDKANAEYANARHPNIGAAMTRASRANKTYRAALANAKKALDKD